MPNNPPAGTPTPNSAEWHWATARGFDLKAPHWDDLTPEMQEAVRRVVHNLTYTVTAPQSTPTRDAEQAVREARYECIWRIHGREEVADALITAVRQAERVRVRGIVEGIERLNLPERDWVARADVLDALSSEGT